MGPLVIRPARLSDAGAMEACARRAYAQALAELEGMPDVAGGMAEDLATHTGLIASLGSECAGFVLLSSARPVAKIVNLATDPTFVGRGIARALLDAAADAARATGATRLDLSTHEGMRETQAFYRHLGWTETGRKGRAVGFQKVL